MQTNGREIVRLFKIIESSPGTAFKRDIANLHTTIRGQHDTYRNLNDTLSLFSVEDHALKIMGPRHPERKRAYFARLHQTIEPYFESSRKAVDHIETLIKKAQIQSSSPGLTAVKERTVYSSLGCFTRCLANYSLHKGNLPIGLVHEWNDNDGTRTYVEIDRAVLALWEGWNRKGRGRADDTVRKGREYLERTDNRIVVLDLINKFQPLVDEFIQWALGEVTRAHDDDLNELATLEAGLRQLYAKSERGRQQHEVQRGKRLDEPRKGT